VSFTDLDPRDAASPSEKMNFPFEEIKTTNEGIRKNPRNPTFGNIHALSKGHANSAQRGNDKDSPRGY